MKTKNRFKNKVATLICLLMISPFMGYSQKCSGTQISISVENIKTLSSKVVEFDVYVINTGSTSLSLAGISGAMTCDERMIGNGAIVSFSPIKEEGNFSQFNPITAKYSPEINQLRWFQSPVALKSGKTIDLPIQKKMKFGSFRMTSSQPIRSDLVSKMKPQLISKPGHTVVLATVYCNANTNSVTLKPTLHSGGSASDDTKSLNAIAFPNPFTDNFHFELTGTSESLVQIKVYDMLGKLIESKSIEAHEIENTTIGTNYPAGVYNITISQDDNSQSVRIIKR